MVRIACCASTFREVEPLIAAFDEARDWEAVPLLPERAAEDAREFDAWVLVGSDPPLDSKQLLCRSPAVPLVIVGGTVPDHFGVDAWLPESASPRRVVAVVASLLRYRLAQGAPTAGLTRRKSDTIAGNSLATRQLLLLLDRFATSVEPVLVTGERGSGKSLVARALHQSGPQAAEPFSRVNCATLSEAALEEHLAGLSSESAGLRGSGTTKPKGGTLLLNEVSELPGPLQAILLGALEAGPPSGSRPGRGRRVVVRVVATTRQDLHAAVERGQFLDRLHSLLRASTIHVPPLRERPEDIAPIVRHHLGLICERQGRPSPQFTPAALEKLMTHDWPGNVRELVDVLDRALLVAEGIDLDVHDIVLSGAVSGNRIKVALPSYRTAKSRFEHAYYSQLMSLAGGNVSLAAKLAKKTRKEIYDALRRLRLSATAYRGGLGPGEDVPGALVSRSSQSRRTEK